MFTAYAPSNRDVRTGAVSKGIQRMRSLRLAMASPLDTARSAHVSASPGAQTGAAEQLDLLKAAHARVATLEAAVRQQGARLEQAQAALAQAEVEHMPGSLRNQPAFGNYLHCVLENNLRLISHGQPVVCHRSAWRQRCSEGHRHVIRLGKEFLGLGGAGGCQSEG